MGSWNCIIFTDHSLICQNIFVFVQSHPECDWYFAVSFNSFMSYAYTFYQHLKELSLYVQHCPHCMLSFHGFPWVIFLNPHWFVTSTCISYSDYPCEENILTLLSVCFTARNASKILSCAIVSKPDSSVFDRGKCYLNLVKRFSLNVFRFHC